MPMKLHPVRHLGFHHPSGEVHISDTNWNSCSGQENPSDKCTDGAVGTIVSGSILDHLGPYDGVGLGVEGTMIRC